MLYKGDGRYEYSEIKDTVAIKSKRKTVESNKHNVE